MLKLYDEPSSFFSLLIGDMEDFDFIRTSCWWARTFLPIISCASLATLVKFSSENWSLVDDCGTYSWIYLRQSSNLVFLLNETETKVRNFLNLAVTEFWSNAIYRFGNSQHLRFCSCYCGKHKFFKCQQNPLLCSNHFLVLEKQQDPPNDDVESRYPRYWHRGRNYLQPGCPLQSCNEFCFNNESSV